MSKIASHLVNGFAALALSASGALADGDKPDNDQQILNSGCVEAGISEHFCDWATDGGDVVLPDRREDAVLYSEHCAQYGAREAECADFTFQLLGGVTASVDHNHE